MKQATMEEMVKAVRAFALEHYDQNGWDFVVESWTDEDLREVLTDGGCQTVARAITEVGGHLRVLDERRQDVMNEIF